MPKKQKFLDQLSFRSPQEGDAQSMADFINELSAEKTYIRLQGDVISLESEEKYLVDVLQKIKQGEMVVIQAWLGKELIGSVDLKRQVGSEKHIAIYGIIIKKAYRGKGLGKELTRRVLEAAKEILDVRLIVLSVFAENEVAKNLYQSFGFKEYGRLPGGVQRQGKFSDHLYLYLKLT